MSLQIRSRILEFLPTECLYEIDRVRKDRFAKHNNDKVDKIVKILDSYEIEYTPLGPGTNRYAILIDSYVIKIALDNDGVNDNWQEFALSAELQPFVIKVYECNGTFMSCEYITLIAKDEFADARDEIQDILARVSQEYLIGDVGTITKNYLNWGFRDDGQLVILDFAYFFEIDMELMKCGALIDKNTGRLCEGVLEYDHNFHDLVCPQCRKTYISALIRARITQEDRIRYTETAKATSYKVTEVITPVYEDDNIEEDINVRNRFENEEEIVEVELTEEEEQELEERAQEELLARLSGSKFSIEELSEEIVIDEPEYDEDEDDEVDIDRDELDTIINNALGADEVDNEEFDIDETEDIEEREYLTKFQIYEDGGYDEEEETTEMDMNIEDETESIQEEVEMVTEEVHDGSDYQPSLDVEKYDDTPETEPEITQSDFDIEVVEVEEEVNTNDMSAEELSDLLDGLDMEEYEEDDINSENKNQYSSSSKSFVLELAAID